ncbi:MAG TPA: acetylxylan esterase [Candidatus Hydrogenedentes bacterium]|nr:acetylxylan esterase [Candidatus Hydrogenedentota bacterium]
MSHRWRCLLLVVLVAHCSSTFAKAELPPFDALPENPALPDPFIMLDGTPVKTTDDWYKKRRPELKQLFQHYMYGYLPDAVKIESSSAQPDLEILDGKAILRQVVIAFPTLPENAPRIHLTVILPKAVASAPVFVTINKCGNHTVLADPAIRINPNAILHKECPGPPEEIRGKDAEFWCIPYLIERGYGFATFHESDIDPDVHDFTDGIHPFFPQEEIAPENRWATIAAWAWGIHRAVDYLSTAPGVDPRRICVTGHSRRGKTALFAGAMDERIALVVPHQSGTGGAALSRDNDQETVERINRVFPHWFNDAFVNFGDHESKLPIDQHLLMAMVAPRPLIDTMGLQDKWANYDSSLRAVRAAAPVWKLLGAQGLAGDGVLTYPQKVTSETAGTILQYRRDTKHTMDQGYWEAILDFADLRLPRP